MNSPRIGLLPLYLQLYDKTDPLRRNQFLPFLETIRQRFQEAGIGVVAAGICCVEDEFAAAVRLFEQSEVDLIVAVHLAYSPSLEAVAPLEQTPIPILLLDTTMDYDFGQAVAPDRIMYNHGIHGVQDLASVLRRRGRPFEIVAGHVTESDVLDRAVEVARAAHAAKRLRGMRVLRIGESFRGMGDFAVSAETLRETFGIAVDTLSIDRLAEEVANVKDEDVQAEVERDAGLYEVEAGAHVHRRTVAVGLALRHLIDGGAYGAFSMNFLAFDSPRSPVNVVPFLEASKAMARGLGYAGEGDVLTACLVGALNTGFGSTTFTEIFCPDWKGGSIFLSHMGEMNPQIAATKPALVELQFPYTEALNPAILVAPFAPGPATLVNLAPGPGGSFGLIASEVEVLGDATNPEMRNGVRAWIRTKKPLPEFLELYSRHGGTHHSALVYGDKTRAIEAFANFTGLDVRIV
jgi:L-arabinose isomerase